MTLAAPPSGPRPGQGPRWWALAGAVLLCGLAASPRSCAANAAAPDDLLATWQQARAADPLRAIAEAERGVQRELATQARAAWLPQWQVGSTERRPQDGGPRSHETVSSLSQAVFDLARLRTLDAERTLETAQDARVVAAEQALAGRVAQAYFGVLSAQAALAAAETNEAAFAAQVAQSQARFEAGLAAQVDVEQSRTYHALARGGTVQARQSLADARAALAQVTGRPPGPLRALAGTLPVRPPEPVDAEAWVQRALAGNPGLRALALGLQASEQRIGAAQAEHAPRVGASLDTRRGTGGQADPSNGRTQTALMFHLTLPLFAGGAIESGVRRARHQRDAARETLELARRAVERETRAQHDAVLAGGLLLEATAAAVAAADRALEATRSGHALGTRSNTDLLLAIQTQSSARNAHDRARHQRVLAQVLLQQAVGTLGEAELAAINALLETGDR